MRNLNAEIKKIKESLNKDVNSIYNLHHNISLQSKHKALLAIKSYIKNKELAENSRSSSDFERYSKLEKKHLLIVSKFTGSIKTALDYINSFTK